MIIPVKNIYFLLCYAWNNLDEAEKLKLDAKDSNDLMDLFARVLISGINFLFKRGIDRQYVLEEEAISGVRGKMNLNYSIKHNLLIKSKMWCEYDELSTNVLHNQIIKTTLCKLLSISTLDKELLRILRVLHSKFSFVDHIRIQPSTFASVNLNRNNLYYKFLLNICRFINENLLTDEETSQYIFQDFLKDEKKMRKLFQSFVFNFFKLEQSEYKVYVEDIQWNWKSQDSAVNQLIPKMQTDISLSSPSQKIIIDTKYYKEALVSQYETQKLISSNMYQIYAYLKNCKKDICENTKLKGILLYPTVNYKIDADFSDGVHELGIKTIDLNQDSSVIKHDLLEMIKFKNE